MHILSFCKTAFTEHNMAAPRLPFLWPTLFRQSKSPQCQAAAPRAKRLSSARRPLQKCRQFTTSPRHVEQVSTQRYGKAHEPAPHLREQEAAKEAAKETEQKKEPEQIKAPEKQTQQSPKEQSPVEATTDEKTIPRPTDDPTTNNESFPKPPLPPVPLPPDLATPSDPKPPESILYMPGPQETEAHKPPHLKTPRYVHHFDTYGLVRELARNNAYTSPQSITIMKGVRQMLLDNMSLARDGLVSKSNVENETYLFRAASSELKNEIGNARKTEIERMRTERNQLQHEVDILSQKLGQEMSGLRDELKGLFDDRKMAVRQEQRSMQTEVRNLYINNLAPHNLSQKHY